MVLTIKSNLTRIGIKIQETCVFFTSEVTLSLIFKEEKRFFCMANREIKAKRLAKLRSKQKLFNNR